MEANFKLSSLNKSEKSLLMSLCDFYQITYKQEVIDETSKTNINILNLSTAQDHLSACLFVSEAIDREIDEFVLDSKYIVSLADILNKEWAKAETMNKIKIMDIMIKLGMRNEA